MKSLEVRSLSYDFSFQLVYGSLNDKYFIKVKPNESGEVIAFEMKKRNTGEWVVIHPAPEWILDMQDVLSREIILFHDAIDKE